MENARPNAVARLDPPPWGMLGRMPCGMLGEKLGGLIVLLILLLSICLFCCLEKVWFEAWSAAWSSTYWLILSLCVCFLIYFSLCFLIYLAALQLVFLSILFYFVAAWLAAWSASWRWLTTDLFISWMLVSLRAESYLACLLIEIGNELQQPRGSKTAVSGNIYSIAGWARF